MSSLSNAHRELLELGRGVTKRIVVDLSLRDRVTRYRLADLGDELRSPMRSDAGVLGESFDRIGGRAPLASLPQVSSVTSAR